MHIYRCPVYIQMNHVDIDIDTDMTFLVRGSPWGLLLAIY